MYPYLFEIGPVTVASFGLMVATGFLVAMHILGRELKSSGIAEPTEVAGLVIYGAYRRPIRFKRLFSIYRSQ